MFRMVKITFVKFIEVEVQNVCRHKSQNRGRNHNSRSFVPQIQSPQYGQNERVPQKRSSG
jgi:hypothetical protein